MATYLGGLTEKATFNDGLPTHNAAVHEKRLLHSSSSAWLVSMSMPLPGRHTTRVRLPLPNPSRLYHYTVRKFGRRRGTGILLVGFLGFLYLVLVAHRRLAHGDKSWPTPFHDPSTLVYRREDLQKIWEWEIAAGHYPSRHRIPAEIGLQNALVNPALPLQTSLSATGRFRRPTAMDTNGAGPKRVYMDLQPRPPNVAYPFRPVAGSIADMDVIMEHCDFSEHKYVRDCLEVLRYGGGLELGARVRRSKMERWKYIYKEESAKNLTASPPSVKPFAVKAPNAIDLMDELPKKRGAEWEPHLHLPQPPPHVPHKDRKEPCDPQNPHIFHMFWTGPFTDKPYLALLSFLFTQNLGLHHQAGKSDSTHVCRPKFWLWINPGPAASVPNPTAVRDMYDELKKNPWASPFLHPRFKDVVHFKMWNTTEQLDGVPELKDEWRAMRDNLFNSGGYVEKIPQPQVDDDDDEDIFQELEHVSEGKDGDSNGPDVALPEQAPGPTTKRPKNKAHPTGDDKLTRVGSTSASTYDRLSVILSDMARFVLTHRFGGIYLDADTLLLRDWTELLNHPSAFAYRWSRLPRYNTAVLKMHRGSALGTFLFRTALRNGMDFHPMSVSRYVLDARLEGLLWRAPDALFDAAWLGTEGYQRERPPQPYFAGFQEFFDTPALNAAAPQAVGFDGFFRGSYSYHFHNFWWKPFDPARNFPDLGPRFATHLNIADSHLKVQGGVQEEVESVEEKRDLDWATVLKRTFEAYVRGERPNMYGEWIQW